MGDWDKYWAKKQNIQNHLYDRISVLYRELILKPYLKKYISKYFDEKSIILHAGCGSGQVEEEIADFFSIIGMDISKNALTLYKQCHIEPNLILGDISSIGIKNESIDGIYNLGVLEHFSEEEIHKILLEFNRVLKSKGTAILFVPPEYGSTVVFFKCVHFFLNSILKKNVYFHPPEPSRIRSKNCVKRMISKSGFKLEEFNFSFNDLFTYMIVVIKKID